VASPCSAPSHPRVRKRAPPPMAASSCKRSMRDTAGHPRTESSQCARRRLPTHPMGKPEPPNLMPECSIVATSVPPRIARRPALETGESGGGGTAHRERKRQFPAVAREPQIVQPGDPRDRTRAPGATGNVRMGGGGFGSSRHWDCGFKRSRVCRSKPGTSRQPPDALQEGLRFT
jgi:hypothetical protein